MDRETILARLDAERRGLARDGENLDVRPTVTRLRVSDGSHHAVVFSSLTARDADAAIAAEVEHHRAIGAAFEWKRYAHDAPADLIDRLRRHGFDVGPREAVMVYDLARGPAWAEESGATREVVRVATPEHLADYRRVAEEVFGKDYSFTTGQLADAIAAGSTQHLGYVAYADGGEPASIGRLYTHPLSHFGGLYGGSTRAPFRGRGFYRAVIAARAREAVELGARYLLVDALPTSRPILERMGFEHLTDTWPCEWRP